MVTPDEARSSIGSAVYDRDGHPIGRVGEVYVGTTGQPTWLLIVDSATPPRSRLAPWSGAEVTDAGVRMVLAEATMVVHFGFLAYLVSGGFLGWRWPRTFWLHVAAAGWGLASIFAGLPCPLTAIEDWAREQAGQSGLPPGGFIDYYIEGVIYPQRAADLIPWLVATVIAVSWLGLILRLTNARTGKAHLLRNRRVRHLERELRRSR